MPKSDRAKAAEVISQALIDSEGRWREWGTITVARKAIRALLAADYQIVLADHSDGGGA